MVTRYLPRLICSAFGPVAVDGVDAYVFQLIAASPVVAVAGAGASSASTEPATMLASTVNASRPGYE
ncbi:MAG TPA: hypothetical protein VFI92_04635 [Steroidobacteraceae bacterium]|nr:hypothetical protein [Steroidobacteraceae bacterium]